MCGGRDRRGRRCGSNWSYRRYRRSAVLRARSEPPARRDCNGRGHRTATTVYALNDAVSYNGTSYISIGTGPGHQPDISPASSEACWPGKCARGATGVAGAAGATGATGAVGSAGAAGTTGSVPSAGATGRDGTGAVAGDLERSDGVCAERCGVV